jgi:hypothetical protein
LENNETASSVISGYRNSEKTQWRNTVWKIIGEWSTLADGYILTLAGKSFLDRKAAKQHGIKKERLIGVDSDAEAVKHNVRFGRTVIHSTLDRVIAKFNRPIAAINADLCGGCMSVDSMGVIKSWLMSEWAEDALLVLNVSVGREPQKRIRTNDGQLHRFTGLKPSDHRGLTALYFWVPATHVFAYAENGGAEKQFETYSSEHAKLLKAATKTARPLIDENVIAFGSYKAHKMRMDTVIVKPLHYKKLGFRSDKKTSRHIAAKMAHHTMRNR